MLLDLNQHSPKFVIKKHLNLTLLKMDESFSSEDVREGLSVRYQH